MAARRAAVLVGCLYRNTSYELKGCINDVEYMRSLLLNRFNFQEGNIQVLTDDTSKRPTRINIMTALNQIIDQAGPQDVLFFFFSGHGTWIQKSASEKQQAIVPLDATEAIDTKDVTHLITSDNFRTLVKKLPSGAILTILSDSGHSGGLIDGEPPQIPTSSSESGSQNIVGTNIISKSIPPSSFKSPSTIPSPLTEVTGTESDGGILLSASLPTQTAFEIVPATAPAYGAFTGAIREVLNAIDEPITNKKLVTDALDKLRLWRLKQQAQLYCSDGNVDAIFLSQFERKLR